MCYEAVTDPPQKLNDTLCINLLLQTSLALAFSSLPVGILCMAYNLSRLSPSETSLDQDGRSGNGRRQCIPWKGETGWQAGRDVQTVELLRGVISCNCTHLDLHSVFMSILGKRKPEFVYVPGLGHMTATTTNRDSTPTNTTINYTNMFDSWNTPPPKQRYWDSLMQSQHLVLPRPPSCRSRDPSR